MSHPIVFFVVLTFASSLVFAAPIVEIAARQIGDIQYNVDRLSFVDDIMGALKTLSAQTAHDLTVSAGTQNMMNNISTSQSAMGTVAEAIPTDQTATTEARVQVESNLAATQSMLTCITSVFQTPVAFAVHQWHSSMNPSLQRAVKVI
ncbi:hypothetical protein GSI_04262 [Ganoderma sinense ZZ0214-1]|uniref:Transporter n=1 Tax=Ganoderma sinense ZZ0214-1 TaxID=1077348 RepID=A0A2G8SIP4_9APHY|nr:hypothetical protein GSI_04262 [Ganoderma sinense ZZ0214-1]